MRRFVVRKSISIKAQPEQVWDALTNPEKTKKYFFNCKVHSGWKAGDKITFKGKMFLIINIEMSGKILKIVPGEILQYNLENKDSDGHSISIVTDELTYKDGETTVSISDDVGEGTSAEKRYKKSMKGWDKILKGLKKVVEERA